jgi:hypothetical protein
MAKFKEQLFILGPEILDTLTMEEVNATWADMVSMGLDRAPYPEFDIRITSVSYNKLVKDFHTLCDPIASELLTPEELDARTSDDDVFIEKMEYLAGRGITFRPYIFSHYAENSKGFCERMWQCTEYGSDTLNLYTRHARDCDCSNCASADIVLTRLMEEQDKTPDILLYRALVVLLATRNAVKQFKHSRLVKRGIGKGYANTTTITIGKVSDNAGTSEGTGVSRRPHLRRGHIRNQRSGPGLNVVTAIFIEPMFINADDGWVGERTAYRVSKPTLEEKETV